VNRFGLHFHHFGLAVRDPADASIYLDGLGYRKAAEHFEPTQGVHVALFEHEAMPAVEALWPGLDPSPIDRLLKGRDALIYHLCYRSDSPAASLKSMEAAGLRVLPVLEPRPAILFGGRPVSFHNVVSVGLIELVHG